MSRGWAGGAAEWAIPAVAIRVAEAALICPTEKKVLQQIAQETGGRFYQVSHFHPLDKIYADIEEDLRNQYSIGFTPDQPGEPGLYHHIHLTAKKKKEILVVQSRAGYYAT